MARNYGRGRGATAWCAWRRRRHAQCRERWATRRPGVPFCSQRGVVKARRRRPSMAEGGAQLAGVRASSRWRPRKKATDRAGCSAGFLGQLGAVLAVLGGDGGGCGGCGDGDEDGEDGGGDNGGEGAGLRRTDYGHIPPNWNGKYGHFTSIVCISFELDILDYCLSFRILSTSYAQRSAPSHSLSPLPSNSARTRPFVLTLYHFIAPKPWIGTNRTLLRGSGSPCVCPRMKSVRSSCPPHKSFNVN
jgi:hypothetical protein